MSNLCYIYIYDYQCLHDIHLNLDARYDIMFQRDSMQLYISMTKQPLPQNFWGAGIWSLTGMFGNNGAGKSTAIRFILNAVIDGANNGDVEGIVVYEQNGELYVYHNKKYEQQQRFTILKHDGIRGLRVNTEAQLPKIGTFYYQGHFTPEFSYGDLSTVELSGLYNASEGSRLRNDIEKFANTTDSYLSLPISTYLVAHQSQNNYRICRLLIENRFRDVLKDYKLPRYIIIAPNHGGQDHLKFHPMAKDKFEQVKKYINPSPQSILPGKDEYISMFVHFNLLNAYAEDKLTDVRIIEAWVQLVKTKDDVLAQLSEFARNQNLNTKAVLLNIHKAISTIVRLAHYNPRNSTFYLDAVADKSAIEELMNGLMRSNFYITCRFFDMYYTHSPEAISATLSSGEQAFLNLFSRLFDAVELQPGKFSNITSPSLLLLDEAEIGFHPEWQRRYIKTLLDFLHGLYVIAGFQYQIVVSSHSPILLSDIPVQCCNFLHLLPEGRTINEQKEQNQTFTNNVFQLYRNPFFLHEGLIGAHAKARLVDLEKRLQEGKEVSIDEIDLIGDERLHSYFMSLYAKSDKSAAIRYYKQQLRLLGEDVE